MTLGVEDLARARSFYEALCASVTIVRPASRSDWDGYTGAFADPDGYVWEDAHNPDWKLAEDASVHLA